LQRKWKGRRRNETQTLSAHCFNTDAGAQRAAYGRRSVQQARTRSRGSHLRSHAANYFHVLGVTRSYADFYRGFGLAITLFLTAEGVVFWLLASLAKKHPLELRPILLVFMLAYVVFAVISQTYFFMGPVIAELLIAACLLGAIMTAKTASTTRVNA
jgi:hypothetical protein